MAEGLWTPPSYRSGSTDPVHAALALGRKGVVDDTDEVAAMTKRRVEAKRYTGAMAGGDIDFATGRSRDPMFYWRQNNLPFELDKPDEMKKLRLICRMIYLTNPVMASAIDIFSKYPLVGMELRCKDEAITDFHTELFMEQLDYEEFLVDLLREYFLVGEAWPFGSFNEILGVWEDDELLNPDDIDVIKTPFAREPRFEMRLPETLRKILNERAPKHEYEKLMRSYPELRNYMGEHDKMPVSNVLLKQVKFKGDTFNTRGVPIMMRSLRYVIQEEMLNAAQEAVASRLYMPLLLAKLGATAQDLGTQSPWIPTAGDIEEFEGRLDAALAADFRVLVHHFAVDMESVWGREVMPRLGDDFDRLTEKQLQAFGLSKTMISGAQGGETYAADALNRDTVSQLLTSAQKRAKRHFKERALVVAEAQQHYDYEERGGKRYPIMEEVLETDPETGEQRIIQQPKLLVPELHMKTMNLRNEDEQRQFIEALRGSGIPISAKTRMTNIPIDLDEERDLLSAEQVENAVAAARTQKETYLKLRSEGLPIPPDLLAMFEPHALQNDNSTPSSVSTDGAITPEPQMPLPGLGVAPPADPAALMPPTDPAAMAAQVGAADPSAGAPMPDPAMDNVVALPRNAWAGQTSRPAESDEYQDQAQGGRRGASLDDLGKQTDLGYLPYSTAAIYSSPPLEDIPSQTMLDPRAGGLQFGPSHVGIRRYANIDPDRPLDEQIVEARSQGVEPIEDAS